MFYEFSTAPDVGAALSDEKIPLEMKGERNFEVFIAEMAGGWRGLVSKKTLTRPKNKFDLVDNFPEDQ